jgi:hypothetical protein
MKKFAVTIFILLLFILSVPARALVLYYSLSPYTCASTMAGFNLMQQQNVYRLTGPVYVPVPGYTVSLSTINFPAGPPGDGEAILTLTPPPNTSRYSLPPLAVVPPLWVDYSFFYPAPIHRLTVYIDNPVNRFDTKITCLVTGATQ